MDQPNDRDRKAAPPTTGGDATINLPPAASGGDATINLPAGSADATIQLHPPSSGADVTVNFAPKAGGDATVQFIPARAPATDATIQFSAPADTTSADSGATMALPPAEGKPDDGTVALGPGESPRGNASVAFATSMADSTGPSIDPTTGRPVPHVSGYEILGELGRGGMGVVYKARQKKLNRLVALKMVLSGGHASPDALARFLVEAQSVAALQHPNIVQIYEVGEHDSLPHFSLEFVDGAPLDRALAGKPQKPLDAAKLVETLSRAMHFAHAHAILHRDLKPANVLLTSDGVPKITDFGLAKKLEGDSSQTKDGSIMGTPSYMAPEQARGELKTLGPSADIYSLGAMLYEMLVGRPPFLGSSPFDTIMQVIKEEPVPPSRLMPKLPTDIETICLKCLQKEPSKRYASAELLAEDCRRFIAGEPILSRPISPAERAWRWCRRNPRVASLLATVAGLLVLVAVTSTVSALTIAEERNLKEIQRKDAVDAREVAEAAKKAADENAKAAADQAGLALTTMQVLIDKVQTQLDEAPRTQQIKRDLLETAMEGLKAVAKEAERSTSIEATMLGAHMQMGGMFRQLGDTEDAMHEYEKSLDIARRRAAANPDNDASQANLAAVLSQVGDMRQELERDVDAAQACYRESLAICETLSAKPPSAVGTQSPTKLLDRLAEANKNVALTLLKQGNPGESLPLLEKVVTLRQELVAMAPDVQAFQQTLAQAYNILGEVCFLNGDTKAALTHYDECIAQREKILANDPGDIQATFELAESCGNYGDVLIRLGDNGGARRQFERALERFNGLMALDDQNILFKVMAGSSAYRMGVLARRAGDMAEADRHFAEALELREAIVALDPKNDARRMELMLALARTGADSRAIEIAEEVRAGSKDPELLCEVARCYAQCAAALRASDVPRAEAYADRAIAALAEAIDEGYSDRVAFDTDPDLDPIRDLPGYRALSGRIPGPSAPPTPAGPSPDQPATSPSA
jgi:serine/threonine-protein kinase